MKKIKIFLLIFIVLFINLNLFANEVINKSNGIAIHGYDPVAYFMESRVVKGNKTINHTWNNAAWHFSSEENKKMFMENPDQYAPQYGGYCAWAVSEKNTTFDIDPLAWKIIDNKLYLNYNQDIRKLWLQNTAKFIKKGDQNWTKLKMQLEKK